MTAETGEPWYDIEWEDDFQGKKTCRVSLVRVVCRYYPEIYSQNRKPSCSLALFLGDDQQIASHEIWADTEALVKARAEEWAATQANAVREAMLARFTPASS
jgi:hypothetical protein